MAILDLNWKGEADDEPHVPDGCGDPEPSRLEFLHNATARPRLLAFRGLEFSLESFEPTNRGRVNETITIYEFEHF